MKSFKYFLIFYVVLFSTFTALNAVEHSCLHCLHILEQAIKELKVDTIKEVLENSDFSSQEFENAYKQALAVYAYYDTNYNALLESVIIKGRCFIRYSFFLHLLIGGKYIVDTYKRLLSCAYYSGKLDIAEANNNAYLKNGE